jgi:WhiB family transcriptional regulator, redox-sensing transcriptional regulator
MVSENWWDDAACKGQPSQPWFPSRSSPGYVSAYAMQFCEVCPVRLECLTYALVNYQEDGTWGGTSGRTRRQARRPCTSCGCRLSPARAAALLLSPSWWLCEACAREIDLRTCPPRPAPQVTTQAALRAKQRWVPTETARPVARTLPGYDHAWLAWLDERRQ